MIQLISQDEVVSMSSFKDIVKSYKYEMKPTKKQEVLSNQTLDIKNRGMKELKITPGTGDRACLSSPNRDTMIQEAPPFRWQ